RAGQRAFPVWRAADVGRHRAPVVQRIHADAVVDRDAEHRFVHAAELLRLDAGLDHRVDLLVAGPEVLERDRLAIRIDAEHVLLDVEAHGAGDRIGDHQRRRSEERLLGVRMDAAVEVAVARQHGGRIEVAFRSEERRVGNEGRYGRTTYIYEERKGVVQ